MRLRVLAVLLLASASACVEPGSFQARKADPNARPGGTLRVGITAPASIDPAGVDGHDAPARLVVRTMCDPLVQLDPITGEPVPALAESWAITDAGKRLTMKLRAGARFSDGTEVTADDVAHTLFRLAAEETAAPAADILRPIAGFERAHGEELDAGGTPASDLDGVSVIDKLSFEVKLKESRSDFLRTLSHPATSPVPKALTIRDPVGFARAPVCAGPYRLVSPWKGGTQPIRLTRSDGYPARNLGFSAGGGGYADEILFRVYANRSRALAAYRAGRIDAVRVAEEDLTRLGALRSSLVRATGLTLEYIGLPVRHAPFDRRAVRVALSQALNRERIAAVVYGGARPAAASILPPAVGQRIYREDACGERAPRRGNLAAARTTLASSGVDLRGTTVRLHFNDEFRNRALLEEVAAQWRDAFGLRTELVALPWERYLDTGTREAGFDGPFRLAWAPQHPSADEYLFPLFESSRIGLSNLTGFGDREFNRSIERDARRATEPEDQRIAYQALEDIACEQMPAVPVVFGGSSHLVRSSALAAAIETFTDRASGDLLVRELFVRDAAG